MRNPKVTVLMPAYNAGAFIGDAIRSVLAQTFTAFELLIIDDGSTDNTGSIVRSFNDPRIRLITQSNRGISTTLNLGLSESHTEYIARFDADDICYPNRLEAQFSFLQVNPEYVIVGCNADYHDMNDQYVFTYQPPGHSSEDIDEIKEDICPFIHSGVMYKKQAVLNAGGYNEHAHTFEDHLLWIKLLQQGRGCNLSETLIRVRLHPASITIDEKWRDKRFSELKRTALHSGDINTQQGDELMDIIRRQNSNKIKQGSYYALLAKKYLWDNHQPSKARYNIGKALAFHPGDVRSYGLWLLSFFPKSMIRKIYSFSKNGKYSSTA
ncbi:MAG TPA: glycosyltransferase [Chitinophagaceae bacterium]|jgi:glycosyltransferase involved in cell wall biosynthesis|nr:glycosyltransferase [Chitinophagaceae bacterium]